MINKYEIRNENNEDVLYIYLDLNYEFSNEFFIKLLSKIPYKGKVIKIISNGILVSTILLSGSFNNTGKDNYSIDSLLLSQLKNNYLISEKSEEIKAENKEIFIDNSSETKLNENTNISSNKIETDKNSKSQVSNNISQDNSKKAITVTTQIQSDAITKNETLVSVIRSTGTIQIELEKYLVGVVSAEMPASFNTEALKAQAVVARTYTLKKISKGLSIRDSVSDQVYKSDGELKQLWGTSYSTYYNKIKSAVDLTRGQYITYNNEYIEAVYHSTSNGYTENSSDVWGNSYSYLTSVDSIWDKSATSYIRTIQKTYQQISRELGYNVDLNTEIEIISRNETNRVRTLRINNNYYTGIEFRNKLGLRSADFIIEKTPTGLSIITYGYGHGVGMSQYGANGMASNGYNYKQIILHYYKGVSIV